MAKLLKRLRIGQWVRVANPIELAARFYSQQHGGIVGAGYGYAQIIPRRVLDNPGKVVAVAGKGKTSARGLIEFDEGASMWLDADALASTRR